MTRATRTPVRVALIGYGLAGRVFHAPLIDAEPRLSLCMVATRDPARAEAVRTGLPQVDVVPPDVALAHPDIDLVVVASPHDSHAPLARAALDAGKHVVVDKPFTLSLAEARELRDLATRQGRLLSVFQNRRWDSDFLALRHAVEAGLIGRPLHLESRFERFRPEVRDRWRERDDGAGGVWWDLGPHLVDQALCLMGVPEQVQASFARQREGAGAIDWAHVVLDFGHARAILQAGLMAAGGGPRFLLHGDRGSVVKHGSDLQEQQLASGLRPDDTGWGTDPDAPIHFAGDGVRGALPAVGGDQSRYYRGIASALLDGARNPVPPGQAVAVMAVLEAAIASARDGRTATLALDTRERQAFESG
ncbi:MAG: hypothetical protein A2190_09720 [Lysobacterales bacterium RIFOXYA1_FULL_69_10]|nr:MAG: hypothetical protein A2190_09720 [Xanthomonadales bacterium RIFOXYA1_FULL_69_10]